MVRLGRILASVALISVVVLSSCLGGDIDPNVTTYTTIEEQSSHVGSEGGQIQLDDGSNIAIPQGIFDEDVVLKLSRKVAQGELPRSMEEDPDSELISDFYFLQVDKVLGQKRGIALEFPFESSCPANQVRVIEVFNIEDETHVRFVDATVDDISKKVRISHMEFFATAQAIQNYETEFPPTNDLGFFGMTVSLGYAAIADASLGSWTLAESCVQAQSEGSTCSCSIRWGRILCISERAEVTVNRLYGTGDAMMDYACSAVQFADSIQKAYSSAGFETHEKIVVHVTLIGLVADGAAIPGTNKILIRRELGTDKGGELNLTINHETVHTMQAVILLPWWKESSADWIAYYFDPDEEAREKIRGQTVLLFKSTENSFLKPFPSLWGDEIYDYSVLIDYAVKAGHLSSDTIVAFINGDCDPTGIFEGIYRDQADGFAQYLAEEGLLKKLAYMTNAEAQLDGHSSGSVVLFIDVSPLTLPVKCYAVTRSVTFQVSLTQVTSDGAVVIGYVSEDCAGLIDKYETSLSTSQTTDIYLMPLARGHLDAHLELLLEWEPWSPDEFTLTITSSAGGSVTTPGEGSFAYSAGTLVNLVATPGAGYRFVRWSDDVGTVADVYDASTTITMNGNYSITANFDFGEEEPACPWPMFRHNPQHTGRSPYTGPQIPQLKWSFTAESTVHSSPAIGADGTIYVGSADNNLYAINPDGSEKWNFSTGGSVYSSPAIGSDGTIYVGSADNNLYAINPDGSEKWSFTTPLWVDSSPAIGTDGTIYVGSRDGKLYAINPDGTEKWIAYTSHTIMESSPAIGTDGIIYVGSMGTWADAWKLYAINSDGTEKWSFALSGRPYSSPAVGGDGTVYVGTQSVFGMPSNDRLYAINPDGTEKWNFSTGGSVDSSPAIGSDGTIYVGSADTNLYAINPDGSEKWSFTTEGWVRSSPAIGADGTIYVGSFDGKLYAINPDGTEKWNFPAGPAISSSPAIDSAGTIYVGSYDGKLYAIGEQAPVP